MNYYIGKFIDWIKRKFGSKPKPKDTSYGDGPGDVPPPPPPRK